MKKILLIGFSCFCLLVLSQTVSFAQTQFKLLATKKTSTMEKELNEAANAGYRYEDVTGGKTVFGGSEVVVIMSKPTQSEGKGRYQYKLLATSKTSTMQKEMQEAGDNGFEFKGQTVLDTFIGGDEVVVILEKDTHAEIKKYEYKLLSTSKTSTMQKELSQAGDAGFKFVGSTVGKTAFGGSEVVVITRRDIQTK
jgi:hypothetical protein